MSFSNQNNTFFQGIYAPSAFPLQVFLLAVFFSLLCKKASMEEEEDIEEDEEEMTRLSHDEAWLHPINSLCSAAHLVASSLFFPDG